MRHVATLRSTDPVERAHLRDAAGFSPPVHRFAPSPDLSDLVRRYWVPVWSLPAGTSTVQRVLQYPVCLLVVADSYATFVGPSTGLSTRELSGSGWALGTMLQPAAGALLLGGPVSAVTDRTLPLDGLPLLAGSTLVRDVRAVLAPAPDDPARQRDAAGQVEQLLRTLLPVDEEGRLVNAVVEHVEQDRDVLSVREISERFGLGERSLQRLTARRIGLTPKWLVQRRRLHEAAELLRAEDPPDLSQLALQLGYADQAHFGRDFRTVTGLTPGRFVREPRPH
jgi:AraC-like DNA-binding protein